MISLICYGKQLIRYGIDIVNKNSLLTFCQGRDNVTSTIPAKPLNDAQIGGLLFFGDVE